MWYCVDRLTMPENKIERWRKIFRDSNVEGKELLIDGEPRKVISSSSWDAFYERQMSPLKTYLSKNKAALLEKMNNTAINGEFNKYCKGDNEQWELDSLNFYFAKHPLTKVIPQITAATNIYIHNVDEVVEGAQDGEFYIKGKIIPKMKLFVLAGTVIDKDKTKGLVTIQCPSGVVNLKLYKDLFATFVAVDEESDQDSFFNKGTHLLVTGIQRGATFVPKVYKNVGRKSIMKINVDENGNFKGLEEKAGLE